MENPREDGLVNQTQYWFRNNTDVSIVDLFLCPLRYEMFCCEGQVLEA